MDRVWVVMEAVAYEGHSLESVHRTEAGANAAAEKLRSERGTFDVRYFVLPAEVKD